MISEACYSTTDATNKSKSLCPRGVGSSTASGAGLDCDGATITGCGHGTHVGGIAAGLNRSFTPWRTGQRRRQECRPRRDQGVLALRQEPVRRRRDQGLRVGLQLRHHRRRLSRSTRCAPAFRTRVIDAVNMSLGGAAFTTGFCDSNPTKPIIDKLRKVGIATVISAGNEGYVNADSPPGCVSTAINRLGFDQDHDGQAGAGRLLLQHRHPRRTCSRRAATSTTPSPTAPRRSCRPRAVPTSTSRHLDGGAARRRRDRRDPFEGRLQEQDVSQIESAFKTTGLLIKDHRLVSASRRSRRAVWTCRRRWRSSAAPDIPGHDDPARRHAGRVFSSLSRGDGRPAEHRGKADAAKRPQPGAADPDGPAKVGSGHRLTDEVVEDGSPRRDPHGRHPRMSPGAPVTTSI